MESFIADLVKVLKAGKIDRRQFCETVALATTVYAAGGAARPHRRAAEELGVNHISYACSDYKVARDWYARCQHQDLQDKGMGRANLAFGGPEPGKGGAFIITRNFGANEKPAGAVVTTSATRSPIGTTRASTMRSKPAAPTRPGAKAASTSTIPMDTKCRSPRSTRNPFI